MLSANAEAARSCLEAWNDGNFDGWAAPAHSDIQWTSAIRRELEGADATSHGREGLRRFWDEWHAVWNMTIELGEIRENGDTVVVLGAIRTHGGASGADLEQPAAWVFEFEDGLARRVAAYLHHQEALEAAGLSAPG